MNDTRYQYQPRYVKVYRWIRWKPIYCLVFVWACFLWLGRGLTINSNDRMYIPTRWKYTKHLWMMTQSLAAIKMQHMFTFEELIEAHREKITAN